MIWLVNNNWYTCKGGFWVSHTIINTEIVDEIWIRLFSSINNGLRNVCAWVNHCWENAHNADVWIEAALHFLYLLHCLCQPFHSKVVCLERNNDFVSERESVCSEHRL